MSLLAKLKKIKQARNNCLSDIQALVTLANRVSSDSSLKIFFKVRYSDIEDLKEQFLEQHQKYIDNLLANDPEVNVDIEDTIREGFLNDYYSVKALYADMFDNDSLQPPNLNNTSFSSHHQAPQARLPRLEIPKFKGDYKAFASFFDLFNALVHNNQTLTDIEKFNYLITVLEGQPLSLVRTLPLTADNYITAYDTLHKRYSNKRLRAQSHWHALENTQKLQSESPEALRNLLDVFSENLSALKTLGFPVANWDFVLVMMLLKRLDNSLVTKFELEHGSSEIPTYQSLIDFLEKICIAFNTLSYSAYKKKTPNTTRSPAGSFFVSDSKIKCPLCKESHPLYKCFKFLQKTPYERFNFCKNSHLCLNCLSDIHDLKKCQSVTSCKSCNQRHHSLLHFTKNNLQTTKHESIPASEKNKFNSSQSKEVDFVPPTLSLGSTQPIPENTEPTVSHFSALARSQRVFSATEISNEGVLLGTAIIHVQDNFGVFQPFRCLLDSGSMTSFITLKAANRLCLPKNKCSLEINGVGSMRSKTNFGSVTLMLKPVDQESNVLVTDAVILKDICNNLPSTVCTPHNWVHIRNLKLADSNFFKPDKVDILLGSDVFSKILLDGRISGNEGEPDAINTIFGYILLGRFSTPKAPQNFSFFCNTLDCDLNNTLKKFWEVETVPSIYSVSPDDQLAEDNFANTHARDSTGRYVVGLPFRDDILPNFIGMRDLAINRFLSLEKRLLKQPNVYSQYKDFMQDYLDLNHMELVTDNNNSQSVYYLPHHCVIKPDSQTTKLRVVFNASAKLPNQTSLNDHLLVGPKLQKDIMSILINFRIFQYVLCADIKQMYRMILLKPAHCDFQRIVFRFSPDEPLQNYRLKTVTYGLSSAPFLALRTLQQLVIDEGKSYPLAAHVINNFTYVDDIIAGSFYLEEAQQLQRELISLLAKGGFQLRKWSSNQQSLLKDLDPDHLSFNPRSLNTPDIDSSLKVLGLKWNPIQDSFTFEINLLDRPCTKRNLLSELARVFDPLGYLSPILCFNKILIQKLWSLSLGWDEPPPTDIIQLWAKYKNQLPCLSKIEISRKLFSDVNFQFEIHGFCDASEKAYAAVVYLRIFDNEGNVIIKFLCAKTKVAPLTKLTIPRLELCAAVLLCNLVTFITLSLKHYVSDPKIYAWSDSQIVLCWLKSAPHRWKTFVSNRVTYIQNRIPPHCWYHVRSFHNPADLASRGCLPLELLSNTHWLNGPDFLNSFNTFDEYDNLPEFSHPAVLEETKKNAFFCTQNTDNNLIDKLLNKFSSFLTIQRILAYVFRFIFN